MSWQIELKEYIARCLRLGFSKDEIRADLRSVGWQEADIENSLGSVTIQQFNNSTISAKMLSADKSPNLLLPSPSGKFPAAVKTAIPLLLSLLSRRAEALKRAAWAGRHRLVLKLLSGFKREPLEIAAAPLSHQLLLMAPSRRTIWFIRFQFFTEHVFSKIESAAIVAGRVILLPAALFSLIIKLTVSLFRSPAPQLSGTLVGADASPATMLIGKRFPEHIVALDIFKLAGRMFRTRRLRTFLTISGISVGIGTILFLVSFGYGLQNILFERITTQEALLTLDVVPPMDSGVVAINDAAVEEMRKMEEVEDVSKMVALNGEMEFSGSSAAGVIFAVYSAAMRGTGIKPEAGGVIDGENNAGAVISTAAMKLLGWDGGSESALDKELSFVISLPKENGEIETIALEGRFKVTGAVDDPMSVFVYLPIEKTSGLKLQPYSQLKVKVKDTALLDPALDKILKMGFLVSMLSETVDQAKKVFNVVKLVLGLFGVITLVVSAIGMLNTLTIALLERTQEVGIMKAVGASNFDIWKLFLAEAILMGFLGGVGGIAVGFISAEIFNYGINLLAKTFGGQALNLFQTPTWFILTIIAFSSCIGIITGLWPARRAAGLDPLDALKYK